MNVPRLLMLLMALVALVSRPAAANDTETGFTAGQPYPLKSATLRLLSEDLQVTLEPRSATVEVTFVLRNEGAARDVVLGFPYFATEDKKYEDFNYAGDLRDFECKVDGQPVTLSRSRGKPLDPDFKSTSWYTWTVHFDAGQTRKVWHRFGGALGSSVAAQLPNGKDASTATFYYILTTARNWKAPIGEFHLTIRPKAPLALSDIYAVSLPMRAEGGVLRADRTQFTPAQELRVQLFARFLRDKLSWTNPAFRVRKGGPLYSSYPPDSAQARALRAVVETRYGKRMKSYNIVPYKDRFFAATATDRYQQYAVWEYVNGRWSFVFEHGEVEPPTKLDPLYAKNGFSPAMRKRLTQTDWEDWR